MIPVHAAVKPVWTGPTLVGSAYILWTRPGDNLGIHQPLEDVQPGDVIVVNGASAHPRRPYKDGPNVNTVDVAVGGVTKRDSIDESLAESGEASAKVTP